MPYILKNNPEASIIINDLSPTVLCEWKRFLDCELDSLNVYYAAMTSAIFLFVIAVLMLLQTVEELEIQKEIRGKL